MSASPDELTATPAMPMEWTPSLIRALFPVKLGRGLELEMTRQEDGGQLLRLFDQSGRGRGARFPGSAQGWTAAWEQAAEWASPVGYLRAMQSWTERMRRARTPIRQPAATIRLDAQLPPVLSGLTYLGGYGHSDGLTAGRGVDLRRASSAIILTNPADGAVLLTISGQQLISAEATGPEHPAPGPFVATAGRLGVPGLALEEVRRLNERYGADQIHTLIRIQGTSLELFLSSASYQPEAAQLALSAVRALAQARPAVAPPAGLMAGLSPVPGPVIAGQDSEPDADLVTKLERLARLRDSGALTQFEFQAAKDKLLH
jgi:putative oligomerization/nucleic acid binding protein